MLYRGRVIWGVMMLSEEYRTGGDEHINRVKYRFRSDCISFRGEEWNHLYLNEGCMKDKERRILFGLRDGGRCAILCVDTGLDWNLRKIFVLMAYMQHTVFEVCAFAQDFLHFPLDPFV